jgi:hypothetical protein
VVTGKNNNMNENDLQASLWEVKAEMRRAGIPVPAVMTVRRNEPEEQPDNAENWIYSYDFETAINGRRIKGESFFEWPVEQDRYKYLGFSLDLGKQSEAPIQTYGFRKSTGYELTLTEAVNLMEGRAVYRSTALEKKDQGLWISLSREEYPTAGHSQLTQWGPRAEVMVDDPRLSGYLRPDERGLLSRQLEHGDRVGLTVRGRTPVVPLYVEVDGLEPRLRWTDGQRKEMDWPDIRLLKFQELTPLLGRGMRR